MRDGDHFGPLVQQVFVLVDDELAALVHRDDADLRTAFLRRDLPRNDVGMVLHLRDQDLVAFFDETFAVSMRDEVDALGAAADEDAAIDVRRVDEAFYLFAGRLVGGRRGLG